MRILIQKGDIAPDRLDKLVRLLENGIKCKNMRRSEDDKLVALEFSIEQGSHETISNAIKDIKLFYDEKSIHKVVKFVFNTEEQLSLTNKRSNEVPSPETEQYEKVLFLSELQKLLSETLDMPRTRSVLHNIPSRAVGVIPKLDATMSHDDTPSTLPQEETVPEVEQNVTHTPNKKRHDGKSFLKIPLITVTGALAVGGLGFGLLFGLSALGVISIGVGIVGLAAPLAIGIGVTALAVGTGITIRLVAKNRKKHITVKENEEIVNKQQVPVSKEKNKSDRHEVTTSKYITMKKAIEIFDEQQTFIKRGENEVDRNIVNLYDVNLELNERNGQEIKRMYTIFGTLAYKDKMLVDDFRKLCVSVNKIRDFKKQQNPNLEEKKQLIEEYKEALKPLTKIYYDYAKNLVTAYAPKMEAIIKLMKSQDNPQAFLRKFTNIINFEKYTSDFSGVQDVMNFMEMIKDVHDEQFITKDEFCYIDDIFTKACNNSLDKKDIKYYTVLFMIHLPALMQCFNFLKGKKISDIEDKDVKAIVDVMRETISVAIDRLPKEHEEPVMPEKSQDRRLSHTYIDEDRAREILQQPHLEMQHSGGDNIKFWTLSLEKPTSFVLNRLIRDLDSLAYKDILTVDVFGKICKVLDKICECKVNPSEFANKKGELIEEYRVAIKPFTNIYYSYCTKLLDKYTNKLEELRNLKLPITSKEDFEAKFAKIFNIEELDSAIRAIQDAKQFVEMNDLDNITGIGDQERFKYIKAVFLNAFSGTVDPSLANNPVSYVIPAITALSAVSTNKKNLYGKDADNVKAALDFINSTIEFIQERILPKPKDKMFELS